MADELERVADKIGKRIASYVIREAQERGVHPMDFAETFADALMAAVMGKMVAKQAEAADGGSGC